MTKKKLVLNTETLRLLGERDARGVHGGSVTTSVTSSKHSYAEPSDSHLQATGCAGSNGCRITTTCP